jgi:hypothetical protein
MKDLAHPAAPALRALVEAARRVGAVLPEEDADLVDLETFTVLAPRGAQRKLTHAVEKDVHERAVAAARPDDTMRAFLFSCSGRWLRAARLPHMQLSNEEVVLRTQRYLRQPLSALAGIAGGVGLDAAKPPSTRSVIASCPATSPRRTASGATCTAACAVPSAAAPRRRTSATNSRAAR